MNKSCTSKSETRCTPHKGEMDETCELSPKNRCIKIKKKKSSQKKKPKKKTIKIVSWNINGLRSKSMNVMNKDKSFNTESELGKLIEKEQPDILCFGETKLQDMHVEVFKDLLPFKYQEYNCSKEKKGYSGVAVLSNIPFVSVSYIPGLEDENQGRNLLIEFDNFIIANVYVPNTGSNKDEYRRDFWDPTITSFLEKYKNDKDITKPLIYCGDLNAVRDNDDIYNPDIIKKGTSAGVKEYERKALENFINIGYIDALRNFNKNEKIWTWWDARTRARQKTDKYANGNGWRLDYFLVSEKKIIKNAKIHSEILGSDHCPILLEIK